MMETPLVMTLAFPRSAWSATAAFKGQTADGLPAYADFISLALQGFG